MSEPTSTQVCAAWAVEADLPEAKPALPPERWAELLLVATETLWALSGRQWSGRADPPCEATATLYVEQGVCWGWWPGVLDAGYVGNWVRSPAAQAQRAVKLHHDEVTDVVSLSIGGVAFTDYRRNGSWLYRTDGRSWAEHAGLDVVVVYQWGKEPPLGGKRAVELFAVELGKAEAGDSTCRLPKRVISVVRQGVSMTLLDPQTFLKDGKLGIPEIDIWLASVNPKGLAERGSVWSPDVPRATLG